VLGTILDIGNVIGFSDLMILGMALPNILGLVLLSNKVGAALKDYWGRYKSGDMQPNKAPAKS
jgi:AGCS family alanine or glycine:cation symporter